MILDDVSAAESINCDVELPTVLMSAVAVVAVVVIGPPVQTAQKKKFVTKANIITRLHFNLKPTTRECVNTVTRGHFRSHVKDASLQ